MKDPALGLRVRLLKLLGRGLAWGVRRIAPVLKHYPDPTAELLNNLWYMFYSQASHMGLNTRETYRAGSDIDFDDSEALEVIHSLRGGLCYLADRSPYYGALMFQHYLGAFHFFLDEEIKLCEALGHKRNAATLRKVIMKGYWAGLTIRKCQAQEEATRQYLAGRRKEAGLVGGTVDVPLMPREEAREL